MNAVPGDSWTPSRELLAAFADGELEDRPHLAELLRQIEGWLADHPEAYDELEAQVELTRVMAATAAALPASATWAEVWSRIVGAPRVAVARWKVWSIAGLVTAAAAAIVFAVLRFGSPEPAPTPAPPKPGPSSPGVPMVQVAVEPLEVATADEIEIVRVAGADTGSLVTVNLPINRPIELLEPHEVDVQPPANNSAGTEVHQSGSGPIVWTPLPRQRDDDDN
jgi:hypothetical protein